MRIETHDDDSVTLTVGSLVAHIKGASWKDANEAAHALGYLAMASFQAANIRSLLDGCQEHLDDLERALRRTERTMRDITEYSDAIAAVKRRGEDE